MRVAFRASGLAVVVTSVILTSYAFVPSEKKLLIPDVGILPGTHFFLEVGDSIQMNAQVVDLVPGVSWSSSNQLVATMGATGMLNGIAPGEVLVFARAVGNPSVRDSVPVTIVPAGTRRSFEVNRVITEVCPNDDETMIRNTRPYSANLRLIHEFHDCQRLIANRTYGPVVGIFAHHNLRNFRRAIDYENGRLVAIVVNFTTKRRTDTYLPLALPFGTSCLVLKYTRGDGGRSGRWDAGMVTPTAPPSGYADCNDGLRWADVPQAARGFFEVRPQTGVSPMGDSVAPPVARWDWDSRARINYIGIRCDSITWCDIGPTGFTPSTPLTTSTGQQLIKGYYDEQYLADEQGAVSATWGTITPGRHAAIHSTMQRNGRPYHTATVTLATKHMRGGLIPQSVTFYDRLFNARSQTVYRRGAPESSLLAELWIASPAPWGKDWVLSTNQRHHPRHFMKYRSHPSDRHDRFATVRWRWKTVDETAWTYCPEDGCCEMERGQRM